MENFTLKQLFQIQYALEFQNGYSERYILEYPNIPTEDIAFIRNGIQGRKQILEKVIKNKNEIMFGKGE